MRKIIGLTLGLLGGNAVADDTLFTGSIVNEGSADNIIDYRNDNGAQITTEGIISEQNSGELGLRTPRFEGFRLNGALTDDLGYTTFVEREFNDNKIRAGVAQNSELFGALVGGELNRQSMTLDGDVGIIDREFEARGFLAVMPGNVYINVGGNLFENSVTSTQGLIRKGFGFYNVLKFDIDDQIASGKLIVGDKFAMTKPQFDFRSQLKTGTELENITTGTILAGWAPFDAYCSERFSLAVNWNYTSGETTGTAELGYNIDKKIVITNGVSYNEDLGVRLGLLSHVPGTPFEAWLNGDYNLATNEITTTAYVGGNWGW